MQPLGGAHTGSLLVRSTNLVDTTVPANTENWLGKKIEDIKPDEKFFHQYFSTKVNKLKTKKDDKKSKEEGDNDDDEEDDNEMDDDEVWKALVKSRPEVEDASEDDFSDFDEEDFADMDSEEENEEDANEEKRMWKVNLVMLNLKQNLMVTMMKN